MDPEEMRQHFLNLSARISALEQPCEQQTSTSDFVVFLIVCIALAVVGEACCGKERY